MGRWALREGLPAHGELAVEVPAGWAKGREGVVVGFTAATSWLANVRPGIGGLTGLRSHPDGSGVLVFARGDCWRVHPDSGEAEAVARAVDAVVAVPGSPDLVLSTEGLALLRLGVAGVVWRTRRLSWDGLEGVRVRGGQVVGRGWDAVRDCWSPLEVDLATGAVTLAVEGVPRDDGERLAG